MINRTFLTKLAKIDDKDPELGKEEIVKPILVDMEKTDYSVSRVKRGERRRKPSAPFITSTLQQDASRKLGFTAKRTMGLAQGLYEGQDVGEGGTSGLITYMRTNSTNIAEVARDEVRKYIAQRYGNDFLPEKPVEYTKKVAGAQEAHEAIRPTSVLRDPDKVKPFLEPAMFKLYQLIWQRFVACQMEYAVYATLSVDVTGKGSDHVYTLRAAGSAVKFPGFLVVYEEGKTRIRSPRKMMR